MGALAALIREAGPERLKWGAAVIGPWILAACLGVLVVYENLRSDLVFTVVGYSVFAFAPAAVVLGLTEGRLPWLVRALEWRPVAHLGTVSYGAYLFHCVCLTVCAKLPLHWIPGTVVVVLGTWGVATLLWRTLEAPVLKYKDVIASYSR